MLEFERDKKPSTTLQYLRDLTNVDPLEREIAITLLASNLERIHQGGLAVDGSKIGEYTPFTKRSRGMSGRQIAFVDLFMSGKLQADLVAAPGNIGWLVGFQSDYGKRLRTKQEERFGKVIWGITSEDDLVIAKIISAFISNPQSGFIS